MDALRALLVEHRTVAAIPWRDKIGLARVAVAQKESDTLQMLHEGGVTLAMLAAWVDGVRTEEGYSAIRDGAPLEWVLEFEKG